MEIPQELIAILVPLGAFALTAFCVGAALFVRHRARELRHQTIRLALEKGQPIPPQLLAPDEGVRRAKNDLSIGVKLLFAGIGISGFLGLMHVRAWASGLVVVALGIGYIVAHALTRRERAGGQEEAR